MNRKVILISILVTLTVALVGANAVGFNDIDDDGDIDMAAACYINDYGNNTSVCSGATKTNNNSLDLSKSEELRQI